MLEKRKLGTLSRMDRPAFDPRVRKSIVADLFHDLGTFHVGPDYSLMPRLTSIPLSTEQSVVPSPHYDVR